MHFIYDKKETYTQEDVETLLKQHNGFKDKGAVSQKDFNDMKTSLEESTKKLGEYTSKEKEAKITKFASEINTEKAAILAKRVSIKEDATDEEIKAALSEFNNEVFATPAIIDTTKPNLAGKKEKQEDKPESRFVNREQKTF